MKLLKMNLQLFADGGIEPHPTPADQAQVEQTAATVVEIKKPTAEELAAMTKEDLDKLKADIQAAAQAAVEEVEQAIVDKEQNVEETVESWTENFRSQHGISWQVALIGGAFVVWQVGAVVARALGVH